MSYFTSKSSSGPLGRPDQTFHVEGKTHAQGITRFGMSAMPPPLVIPDSNDSKADVPPQIIRDHHTIARPSGNQVVYFITAETGSGRLPSLYHIRPNGEGVRLRLQHRNGPRSEVIPNVMHHSYESLEQRNSAASALRSNPSISPKDGGVTGLCAGSHHLEFDAEEFDPASDPHRHVHKSGGRIQRLTTVVSAEDFAGIETRVTELHNLLEKLEQTNGRDAAFYEAAHEANQNTEDFVQRTYPALYQELRARSPASGQV